MKQAISAARLAAMLFLAACGGVATTAPRPEPTGAFARLPLPPMRQFGPAHASPPRRSNADMAQDFLDLSFRLETGRPILGFSRFEGPVSVALAGPVPPTAGHDLDALLARLRAEAGLDLARAADPASASITIEFIPAATLHAFAPDAACFAAPRVGSWAGYRRAGEATLDWTTYQHRQRAAIFIPTGVAPQEVRDCLHEELAQALGPLNDLFRLPDSIFNDDNIQTILTGFDMLMLRATYAPELRPGMNQAEVAARIPAILARLNPRGQFPGHPAASTPRAYGEALAEALGPGAGLAGREGAAERAVAISLDWRDHRTGFALLSAGRLRGPGERPQALADFIGAAALFAREGLPLHLAHARMQLAFMALDAGDWRGAAGLAEAGLPAATAAQDAALMAGLGLARAEALDHLGDGAAAARLRLDSLGWARYGMASDSEVRRRAQLIAEIAGPKEPTAP
ncbi:MAG: DUF2927 domain-containing protein [Proteobacteria bacterium]|nr:DUF2927 domain-containing protein [Pseudomonadota bacterium]MBS0572538.1 DUF2927 domain-containing protein [Pseudomonadota bacterium]